MSSKQWYSDALLTKAFDRTFSESKPTQQVIPLKVGSNAELIGALVGHTLAGPAELL